MPTSLTIIWHPQARQDMLDLYIFAGQNNSIAAEKLYDKIEAKTNLLARSPRMGRRRPDIRPSLRMLLQKPYVILYETLLDMDSGPIDMIESFASSMDDAT